MQACKTLHARQLQHPPLQRRAAQQSPVRRKLSSILSCLTLCVCVTGAEAEHAVASQQDTAGKTAAAPTPAGSGSPTKQQSGSPTKQQSGSPTKHGSGSTFGGLFGSEISKGGSTPMTGGSVSSWLPSWGGGKKETERVTRQAHEAACVFARHATLTCMTLLWMHGVQGAIKT